MDKQSSADRQAVKLLELYCGEKAFEVELADEDHAAEMKAAFEKLGCIVKGEPFKPLLHVTCAEPARA